MQVEIGDLALDFLRENARIEDASGVLIMETHSEHIMLRILRRIREASGNATEAAYPAVRPDDIAVVYVKPGRDGAQLLPMRIAPDGDFIYRWPKGFFEERGEELF